MLYALAEHCSYEDLRDELNQDKLALGICNGRLDADLTLDKAVTIIQQSEMIHQQRVIIFVEMAQGNS